MIELNGKRRELAAGTTVRELLRTIGIDDDARGVAVAIDAEVVPRGAWPATTIDEGARVEILRAIQGG